MQFKSCHLEREKEKRERAYFEQNNFKMETGISDNGKMICNMEVEFIIV